MLFNSGLAGCTRRAKANGGGQACFRGAVIGQHSELAYITVAINSSSLQHPDQPCRLLSWGSMETSTKHRVPLSSTVGLGGDVACATGVGRNRARAVRPPLLLACSKSVTSTGYQRARVMPGTGTQTCQPNTEEVETGRSERFKASLGYITNWACLGHLRLCLKTWHTQKHHAVLEGSYRRDAIRAGH